MGNRRPIPVKALANLRQRLPGHHMRQVHRELPGQGHTRSSARLLEKFTGLQRKDLRNDGYRNVRLTEDLAAFAPIVLLTG